MHATLWIGAASTQPWLNSQSQGYPTPARRFDTPQNAAARGVADADGRPPPRLCHFDLSLALEPAGPSCRAAALLIVGPAAAPAPSSLEQTAAYPDCGRGGAARRAAEPDGPRQGALLAYDFGSCKLDALLGPAAALAAAYEAGATAPLPAGVRVLGGALRGAAPRAALGARVLLDSSVLEVFASTGQALATRAYIFPPSPAATGEGALDPAAVEGAAAPSPQQQSGGCGGGAELRLLAFGGAARATLELHEMGSAW